MNPISAAEFTKATGRIQEAIQEQEARLEDLKKFSEENREISKLVEDLPNNVSYNIMVPFGKCAFFPGKLVHTNEMTVLLGENYYAEQSAKQTLEILSRRAQLLDMKMQNVNAQIADLHVEASFVRNAAQEAAEGVIEIVEDYVEPTEEEKRAAESERFSERKSDSHVEDDDGGFMARLEQLMLAEEEQVGISGFSISNRSADLLHLDEELERKRWNITENEKGEKPNSLLIEEVDESAASSVRSSASSTPAITTPGDLIQFEEWKKQSSVMGKNTERSVLLNETKASVSSSPSPLKNNTDTASRQPTPEHVQAGSVEQDGNAETKESLLAERSRLSSPAESSSTSMNLSSPVPEQRRNKAFTNVIVEREAEPLSSKLDGITPPRPFSRFKQRKG